MKILVLCQRKKTDTNDKNTVNKTVNSITKFIESIYSDKDNFEYTFLTKCLLNDTLPDCADIKMEFNMYNKKTQEWVFKNKGYFDIIILNTCPISFFPIHFWYGMYELLSNKGNLYMMAINSNNIQNILFNSLNMDGKDNTIILRPINDLTLKAIKVLFSVDSNGNFLYKNKVLNDVIYSYLLDESCNIKTLVFLFPILPKKLQNFILNVANFSILYDIPRNQELCKILLKNFD